MSIVPEADFQSVLDPLSYIPVEHTCGHFELRLTRWYKRADHEREDWSENAGVLNSLVEAKIVRDTGERVPTGYVEAALCEVLVCF